MPLTEGQAARYRAWVAHFRAQGLDSLSQTVMETALAKALEGEDPPRLRPATKPLDVKLPGWARAGLAMGGARLVRTVAGPKGLATVAATAALYATLCASSVLPHDWCLHRDGLNRLLVDVGLLDAAVTATAPDGPEGDPPRGPPDLQ